MKSKKGFTIIEVVLVLAIAGLIFTMVFIALPALQRSQRNTQRRHDLERFAAAVVSYRKNNNGKVPFNTDQYATVENVRKLVTRYIDSNCEPTPYADDATAGVTFNNCESEFTDPDGSTYSFKYLGTSDSSVGWHPVGPGGVVDLNQTGEINEPHVVYAANRFECGDEGIIIGTKGLNEVVVMMYLEGGEIACENAN